jgi:hypothetical protein
VPFGASKVIIRTRKNQVAFTDSRLPNKEYKTERGLKIALSHLQRREAVKRLIESEALEPAIPAPRVPVQIDPEPKNHIRNIHYAVARVRIHDEDRDKSRSITLQPRGQRGDLAKVSETELTSTNYLANVNVLFEALTETEAGIVLYKQTTNQQAVHPAAEALRTELGNTYSGGVSIAESMAKRSFTVGEVVDTGSGHTQEHKFVVERRQAASIEEIAAPRRSVLPGTQDHPTSAALRSEEEALRISAEVAKQKFTEGVEAGLAGFKTPKSFSIQTHALSDPADRQTLSPVTGKE